MKRILSIFLSFILFYGCSVSSTNNQGSGSVEVKLPAHSRSVENLVALYTLSISCESIEYKKEYTGYPGGIIEIPNLTPETYLVDVKGYDGNKKELLNGSASAIVKSGETTNVELKLKHSTGKISIDIQLPEEEPEVVDGWKVTFKDDFNGDKIDTSKWSSREYNRRPNPEGPDGWWDKDDVYLSGIGQLVIRVRKIENKNDETTNDNDTHDYSTGMIRSKGKFEQKYGKYEIRCKLPTQAGWWVAFWLFSDSTHNVDKSGKDGTEIDIFEGFGWTDDIHHTLIFDGYEENKQEDKKIVKPENIREGYHTYGLEWTPEEYIFFIDGKETWRSSFGGVSQVPAFIKVTGEISTLDGLSSEWWANNPETASYPDYFFVDYVKVYEKVE